MSKKKKLLYASILVGVFLIITLILLSSVLNVGERLTKISPYVEYGFYVFTFILFFILVLRPILIILFQPTFSIECLFDENEYAKRNYHMYKKVARNLLKVDYLTDDDKSKLLEAMSEPKVLKLELSHLFDTKIKKELNKIIIKNAETIMISTAISQNGRLDFLAVLVVNLRLIKSLVVECGFRPSMAALAKLSINVLLTSLIAEGLEGLDFGELFPNTTANTLTDIPLIRPIASSIFQGLGNALLSLRVGIICRNFLFMNIKGISKKELRKGAFKESVTLMPKVIKESISLLPDRIKTIFEKFI